MGLLQLALRTFPTEKLVLTFNEDANRWNSNLEEIAPRELAEQA